MDIFPQIMQEPHPRIFVLTLNNCESEWKIVSIIILYNGSQQSTTIFFCYKCVIYLHNQLAILKFLNAWLKIPKHTIKNHLRSVILTILHWIGCFVSNNCTLYKVLTSSHPYRQITLWFFPTSKCNFECFLFRCPCLLYVTI